MVRTTITLPEASYEKLKSIAQKKQVPISKYMTELIFNGLDQEGNEQPEKMYESLDRLKGIVSSGDPNFSSNVDEILYGENGAWRGTGE